MSILNRYIIKEILKGSLFALILLVTLVNLFSFSDELKNLGQGSYDLPTIITYLALSTPTIFYTLVPSAALIGSIFVLGAMAGNREIVAMRTCGLSVFWIIRSAMSAGLILVFISMAIGEFIAPPAERAAQLLKTTAQNNRVVMRAKYGIWLREGNSFINIREIADKSAESQLTDLSFYHLDQNDHLMEVAHAQTGNFTGHGQWELQALQKTQLFDKQATAYHASQQMWNTSIKPDLVDIVVVTTANLSSLELIKYIRFLKENKQKSQIFEAALWTRLVNPLVTLVMIFVSTPFVIGIQRGTSIGKRLIIGLVLGLSFNILDQVISHLGMVYQLNPALTALLPSLLLLVAAFYAIRRVL